jgi:hypothetical protein
MDTKGLDKTHRDAVREIAARVLAQLHQLAKRGRIHRIGIRLRRPPNLDRRKLVGVSFLDVGLYRPK